MRLAILFLFAAHSWGAVALVQEQITTSGSSPAAVMDSNVTAGNTLMACHTFFDTGSTTPTIADTRSSTWVAMAGTNPVAVNGSIKLSCWMAYSISGGADTITVTCGGACITGGLVVAEWSGTATSGATGTGASCAGGNFCTGWVACACNNPTTSTNITTVRAGSVVQIVSEFSSGRTQTAGTIFGSAATLFETAGASGFGAQYRTGIAASTSGTATMNSNGAGNWIMATFSIEEPAGGGGGGGTPSRRVIFIQ